MKTEIKEIPFDNGTLLGVRTPDGKVWLAVKKFSCILYYISSKGSD